MQVAKHTNWTTGTLLDHLWCHPRRARPHPDGRDPLDRGPPPRPRHPPLAARRDRAHAGVARAALVQGRDPRAPARPGLGHLARHGLPVPARGDRRRSPTRRPTYTSSLPPPAPNSGRSSPWTGRWCRSPSCTGRATRLAPSPGTPASTTATAPTSRCCATRPASPCGSRRPAPGPPTTSPPPAGSPCPRSTPQPPPGYRP